MLTLCVKSVETINRNFGMRNSRGRADDDDDADGRGVPSPMHRIASPPLRSPYFSSRPGLFIRPAFP